MKKIQWYESLFQNYGERYDSESFTHGTVGECDFIEKELGYNRSVKILDVGCGTGRHSVELAKRGYTVTGVDLSESMLKRAVLKAEKEGLDIRFLKHDARELPFENEFDAAILFCEGSFPLMETDEMNYEILRNISKSLKSRSKFMFTTLNGLFPLYHSVQEFLSNASQGDAASYRDHNFDLMTFRDSSVTEITDDSGTKKTIECNERYYIPSEITWLLKSAGFTTIDIFGAKLGAFSRNDKLSTEDYEMLVVAEKS